MSQTHTAVAQNWEESERGWGVRPDGFSLHLSMEDCRRFREEYWAQQPKSFVPDEYSRERGEPLSVRVDEATFQALRAAHEEGESGIWGSGSSARPDAQGLCHAVRPAS